MADPTPSLRRAKAAVVLITVLLVVYGAVLGWTANNSRETSDDTKKLATQNRQLIHDLRASDLKSCEDDNVNDAEIAGAIHTVFDPGANTPRELEALQVFDDALSPKNCRAQVFGEGARPLVEIRNRPSKVLSRVEGVEGPAVRLGEGLQAELDICVRVPGGVLARTLGSWIQLGPDDVPTRLVPGLSVDVPFERGCRMFPITVPLPPDVGPGRWINGVRVQALDDEGRTVALLNAATEPFEVVP